MNAPLGRADISWLPERRTLSGPIYRAIANSIGEAIRSGGLQPGDRLPPHRTLAATMGIDITTVTRAYAEAQRQGLVEATIGSGTFVRAEAPVLGQASERGIIDLTMNLPPSLPAFPLGRAMQDTLSRLLRQQDASTLMSYRWGAGTSEDRVAGAAWLRPCLGRIDPQHLLVTPGAQIAMLAVLTTLARPGDVILSERITYPGLKALAAQLGLILHGVGCDREGLLPDSLDEACRRLRPRLLYCNPTIQNPTTVTISPRRRAELAAIARRHHLPILEDDAYGLFPTDPIPAIATFAPELTWYVATTAKTLSPGLRIAYLLAPGQAQAMRLTAALRATAMASSGLLSGIVTAWIKSGQAVEILAAVRAEASARQVIARSFLPETVARAHPEGLHVWLRLPAHWQAQEFAAYVRRQGLAIVPEDAFSLDGPGQRAVRIALGAAPDRTRLADALRAVSAALSHQVPTAYASIV
nr:PLP-dependent aminotransferase family protein [uncultured Lichenicoccus sp.]